MGIALKNRLRTAELQPFKNVLDAGNISTREMHGLRLGNLPYYLILTSN
jgi:hypothetical protein